MKHFTPDLLDRFGSEIDAIADKAQTDWEKANLDYQEHYQSIEKSLPMKFRQVLDRFELHDARLYGTMFESPFLFVAMQLASPPYETLVLQYHLLKEPAVIRHNQGAAPCPYLEWLYDEVDVKKADDLAYFEHAILLTNGIEFRVAFVEFECLVLSPPIPETGLLGSVVLPALSQRPEFIPFGLSAIGGPARRLANKTPSGA